MPTITADRASEKKISKQQACYQFHPDTAYVCGDCAMAKGSNCAWFGPTVPISLKTGSCNYFAHGGHGKPIFDVPWMPLFTKEELGYTENGQGFSCKRCEEFIASNDCQKVDKDSVGDTPGEISAGGCCDFWEPDPKRSKMTNDQLFVLLERK